MANDYELSLRFSCQGLRADVCICGRTGSAPGAFQKEYCLNRRYAGNLAVSRVLKPVYGNRLSRSTVNWLSKSGRYVYTQHQEYKTPIGQAQFPMRKSPPSVFFQSPAIMKLQLFLCEKSSIRQSCHLQLPLDKTGIQYYTVSKYKVYIDTVFIS